MFDQILEHGPFPTIRAVVFDFDGTLTQPGALDFGAIREMIGCPSFQPILEYIQTLPFSERKRALQILDDAEFEAAGRSQPNLGVKALLSHLHDAGLAWGIVSRNSRNSVERALLNFDFLAATDIELIVTRDDPLNPKPDPESIKFAADTLGVPVRNLLSVGDYKFDIEAGATAGSLTAFLKNKGAEEPVLEVEPDFCLEDLEQVIELVDLLRPLKAGKLPNRFLEQFLDRLPVLDSSVLLTPCVGEDVTAVRVEAPYDTVVLKSDPITFATDSLPYYAVAVNANDLITSGAVPKWLLTTLLLPVGASAADAGRLMVNLGEVCTQFELSLCGGHTEITATVNQPIVVGHLSGPLQRGALIRKQNMTEGEALLMTKSVGLEGTAILAREFPDQLLKLGLSQKVIGAAQKLLFEPGISVLAEGKIASFCEGVSALHDVTEGGMATALDELSQAGGHVLEVDSEQFPVLFETREICHLVGIDPMGLIGSGALLITCRIEQCERLMQLIREAGVQVTRIGAVGKLGSGIQLREQAGVFPSFEVDEISKACSFLSQITPVDEGSS